MTGQHGPSDTVKPKTVRASAGGAALCLLAVAAAFLISLSIVRSLRERQDAASAVTHTMDVLLAASSLAMHVREAADEGRIRRLDKTAAESGRFDESIRQVHGAVANLRRLTAENPRQQDAVKRLATMLDASLGHMAAPADKPDMAPLADNGMPSVTGSILDLLATEQGLLAVQRASVARPAAAPQSC